MENLGKFEKLLDSQKEKKDFLVDVLKKYHEPNFEVDFKNEDLIKIKIKDKSSLKSYIISQKENIIKEFNQKYPKIILLIS